MERKIRSKKRMNYYLTKFTENIDPFTIEVEQLMATDMLIQIADYQHESPLDTKAPKINGWISNKKIDNPRQQHDLGKNLTYIRKNIHIRPFTENRTHNQSYHQVDKHNTSVIPSLKFQLQKLESPEKMQQNDQKKKKLQYLQSKLKRKTQPLLVQQLFQTKRNSLRIKHFSNDKKNNKIIVVHNFYQTKPRKIMSRQKNIQNDYKASVEQNQLMKEARKNRTLRNILF